MFNIIYSNENEIKILKLSGSLANESITVFRNYFEEIKDENCRYILDLEDLKFIDSMGLGLIIQTLKYVISESGELKILHLNSQPKVIFEITRVESIFEIYETFDEVLKSFKKMEVCDASSNSSRQRAL